MFMPSWRLYVKSARKRGDRITSATDEKVVTFQENRSRVAEAAERAEDAAIHLIERQDALAAAVARRRY